MMVIPAFLQRGLYPLRWGIHTLIYVNRDGG